MLIYVSLNIFYLVKIMSFPSKKKKPFFSIITVVRNGENTIEKTIKSVANQKFKEFEHILIDGKSTDKTL